MFKKISGKGFEEYHRTFKGETRCCDCCGGKCEFKKIGSLMPGEVEFIARGIRCTPEEFRSRYLDAIETPFGTVEVLKLKPGCPFLDDRHTCALGQLKVVMCDIYPVVFQVSGKRVVYFLDEWCPIVSHKAQIISHFTEDVAGRFESKGIPAFQRIEAPLDWYRAVATYDHLYVDYDKLLQEREGDLRYMIFPLDEIKRCQAEPDPPPGLDFSQSVSAQQSVSP